MAVKRVCKIDNFVSLPRSLSYDPTERHVRQPIKLQVCVLIDYQRNYQSYVKFASTPYNIFAQKVNEDKTFRQYFQ